MKIEIRTRGFSLTPAIRTFAERRLEVALDRHRDRISRARVNLADLNGPRGGADKSCRVELRLRGRRTVRATVVDPDAYVAIGAAVHRAARSATRAIERERATTLELLWLAEALAGKPRAA